MTKTEEMSSPQGKNLIAPIEWELSKKSLNYQAQALVDSDNYDPLRLAITAKAMELFAEKLKDLIKDPVKLKMKEQGMNKVNIGNYSITLGARSSFDYSDCSYWRETSEKIAKIRQKHTDAMNAETAALEVELKRIQDAMKMTKTTIKDVPTGKIIPPVKKKTLKKVITATQIRLIENLCVPKDCPPKKCEIVLPRTWITGKVKRAMM